MDSNKTAPRGRRGNTSNTDRRRRPRRALASRRPRRPARLTRRNRLERAEVSYKSNGQNRQFRRRFGYRNGRRNMRLRKLFVGGLPKFVDNRRLYGLFRSEGMIVGCQVAFDRMGISRGFGEVEFRHPRDAWRVIQKWNNTTYAGNTLRIEFRKRRRGNNNRPYGQRRDNRRFEGNFSNNRGYGGYNDRNRFSGRNYGGYQNNNTGYRGSFGGRFRNRGGRGRY